jgi:hypothetical protein
MVLLCFVVSLLRGLLTEHEMPPCTFVWYLPLEIHVVVFERILVLGRYWYCMVLKKNQGTGKRLCRGPACAVPVRVPVRRNLVGKDLWKSLLFVPVRACAVPVRHCMGMP